MEWKLQWKIATAGAVVMAATALVTLYATSATEKTQATTCVVTHIVAYKDESTLRCEGGRKAVAWQEDQILPGDTVKVWRSAGGWTTRPYEKKISQPSTVGGVAAMLALITSLAFGIWALAIKSHH